ncbi:endonuclease VII domain-containing protein [Mycobacteroides abscessus subsp. abscessus]|uniref:endonuclease VII domain-containing protein n=1 Tax=Mycobacteroides abscessus TaxID=36809 RepID=UPI001F15DD52|nr:endonuclease VII domain-containing protein [Mycobacteroides abscessus]MDO3076093.1 endonuclease VII domain-containing protein [Mycobacteroides abscessus subsp. abscessus]MDO3120222.1 endonuclease VII domain-containing protein [Mycobacteroides abscessus subsp. abscessus]MDO3242632.1 endonuclease VII domain-containing protein [Mycobacteroides abscessus subsp. abscessus]MDO3324851.1 endonuclease VII domain-containing protein [Mycobacteroides abscessus subsp. abscessus]WKE41503.1 endonuclease V
MKTYGITAEQYWKLYEYQRKINEAKGLPGVCAICGKGKGLKKNLAVDHDHETGYVRGLLETCCNRNVLGYLGDSIEALERAIEYLKNPPAFDIIGKVVAPIESGQGLDIRPETKEET